MHEASLEAALRALGRDREFSELVATERVALVPLRFDSFNREVDPQATTFPRSWKKVVDICDVNGELEGGVLLDTFIGQWTEPRRCSGQSTGTAAKVQAVLDQDLFHQEYESTDNSSMQ